jgi:hypothetical protein
MADLTLTDVTQVLLKQNQELTVNTAETVDTKKGINDLAKVLGDYFKNQQRLDEGDRLENKREASSAKAGGTGLGDALKGGGLTAANAGFGFLGAISGLLIGLTQQFLFNIATALKFIKSKVFGSRLVLALVNPIKTFMEGVAKAFRIGFRSGKLFTPAVLKGYTTEITGVRKFFFFFGNAMRQIAEKLRPITKALTSLGKFVKGNAIKGFNLFVKSMQSLFRTIIMPFTKAAGAIKAALPTAGTAGKAVNSATKFFGIARSFFPALLKAFQTFATVFSTLGRVIFLPLNIIIGVVQGVRGFIEGFTQSREAGEGFVSSVMGGLLEGVKKAINTLIMYPLDLLKNGIAFLLNAIGLEGAAELLKGFSFASLFGGLIDGIKGLFSGLSDNIMVGLIQMVGRLAKLPIALAAASLAAVGAAIIPGGMTGGEAFQKTFNAILKFGEGGAPTEERGTGTQERREGIEETMLERQARQGQGGGDTIVGGDTINQQNGDSVQLSTQVDDTQNSADRMKRGSRGSRGR